MKKSVKLHSSKNPQNKAGSLQVTAALRSHFLMNSFVPVVPGIVQTTVLKNVIFRKNRFPVSPIIPKGILQRLSVQYTTV